MPLKHGFSKKSIASNIKTEMEHGKPHEQAIAIAMETAREAKSDHKSYGGMIKPESIVEALKKKRHLAHGGMVESEDDEFLSADMETPIEEHEESDVVESQEEMKRRSMQKALKSL